MRILDAVAHVAFQHNMEKFSLFDNTTQKPITNLNQSAAQYVHSTILLREKTRTESFNKPPASTEHSRGLKEDSTPEGSSTQFQGKFSERMFALLSENFEALTTGISNLFSFEKQLIKFQVFQKTCHPAALVVLQCRSFGPNLRRRNGF